MSSTPRIFFITLAAVALITAPKADAGSVGDFFKALGNSIAHPGQTKKPPPPKQPTKKSKTKGNEQTADYPPQPPPVPTPPPATTPTATTSTPPVRPASAPP